MSEKISVLERDVCIREIVLVERCLRDDCIREMPVLERCLY